MGTDAVAEGASGSSPKTNLGASATGAGPDSTGLDFINAQSFSSAAFD